MAGCPFTRTPEPCARRQAFTTPAPSDCRACDFFGRKGVAGETDPPLPETPRSKPEPIPPKKETPVATKGKDAILRRIENEKICGRGRLTRFCSVTAAELDTAVKELEAEGKIKSWEKKRGCLYTLPDAPDPRVGNPPTTLSDATVPSKPPRRVNRKSTSPPIKSRAKTERPVPATRRPGSNGNAIGSAIAELEARRTVALDQVEKIDAVLDSLRVLE